MNNKHVVTIQVPATSANLGPGFDKLGMAVNLFNRFSAETSDALSVKLLPGTCVDTTALNLDAANNLLAQAYRFYFEQTQQPIITASLGIEAHIPLSRGLGSSSTAIVGGLFLANEVAGNPLSKAQLLPLACQLEGHPDNVTPALLGGVHCCSGTETITLQWPEDWGLVYVVPNTPVSTQAARKVLPEKYSDEALAQTETQLSNWIEGVKQKNSLLFSEAIANDVIHEPYRSKLIPEYAALKQFILAEQQHNSELLGLVISGSGSTMLCPTSTLNSAKALKQQLQANAAFADCKIMALTPNTTGASLLAH